jgi:hypothetical protein
VLDPNNAHPNFDQGVARSFVNGNTNDLYSRMEFHDATHVLVDADLVGKWGALVFLSGSCDAKKSPVCPQTAEIDWRAGPGSSKYEAEHYYEYLTVVGQCPLTASPVALPALQSSFGATYCAGKNELFLLTRNGLDEKYRRAFKIAGVDAVTELDANTSYLFPIAQNQFINANPDLSYGGLDNRVFYAAFTRLFFFQNLPGFKLVYSSPRGQVKIFEYSSEFATTPENALPSNFLNPEALANSTPVPSTQPSPSLEPSTQPSVEPSAQASVEASAQPSTQASTQPSASPAASPSPAVSPTPIP